MVTDYEGAKGPRALGPLFLEDGSFHLSLGLSASLSPLLLSPSPFSLCPLSARARLFHLVHDPYSDS